MKKNIIITILILVCGVTVILGLNHISKTDQKLIELNLVNEGLETDLINRNLKIEYQSKKLNIQMDNINRQIIELDSLLTVNDAYIKLNNKYEKKINSFDSMSDDDNIKHFTGWINEIDYN
jgi:hypothetical protein